MLLGVTVFGHSQQVLTLQQCREMALKNNISMRSADNNIEQAKQQKKEAFTNYFPQISGTGLSFHSGSDMIKGTINTSEVLPAELAAMIPAEMAANIPATMPMSMLNGGTFAAVTAVQPIFAGGQIINGNKLAKVGVAVSEIQKEQSEQQVLLTVEKYYWQLVDGKQKQKTIEKIAEMLKSFENDAQTAVEAGLALRNDLLQVQLKQNEVESNRIKLNNKIALGKMLLAQCIGLDENADIDVVVDEETMPEYPISLKQDANSAVVNTPEYRLLQENVQATTLQRKMEIGKNLPSVGVGAGYTYNHLMENDNNYGLVFASVSVPISGWWGGSHAIKRKKLAEENAKQQLSDNTELLKIRIQKNWNELDDAYKQLALAHKSIEQSEENLRINRDQYQAGTTKMSDLLQAENLYQQAADNCTERFTDYQMKKLEYLQSVNK